MVLICFLMSWLICLRIPFPEMFAWSIPQVPFAFMCFYHIAGAGISWVVYHRHRRRSHEVGASFGATAADAVGNSRLTSWAHWYPNDPSQHGMLSACNKFEQSGVSQQELNGIYMIPMVLAHDWPARAMCGAGGAMINGHLHTRKSNVYKWIVCQRWSKWVSTCHSPSFVLQGNSRNASEGLIASLFFEPNI